MLTTAAQSPLAEQRDYLQALQNGTLPDRRPSFDDHLDETIRLIEQVVTESRGNKQAIQNVIAALSRTNAVLAQLVAGEAAEEDITSQALTIPPDDSIAPALPETIAALLEQDVSDACPEKAVYTRFSMQVSPEGYVVFHDTCWYFTLSTIAGHRIKLDLSTPQYTQLVKYLRLKAGGLSLTPKSRNDRPLDGRPTQDRCTILSKRSKILLSNVVAGVQVSIELIPALAAEEETLRAALGTREPAPRTSLSRVKHPARPGMRAQRPVQKKRPRPLPPVEEMMDRNPIAKLHWWITKGFRRWRRRKARQIRKALSLRG